MNIIAANAPVSWGVMEVDGFSQPIPPGIFLDELSSAGYTGTELGPYGYLPTDAALLRLELSGRSLALISAFVPLPLKEPNADLAAVSRTGKLLAALGARHMVLADAMWPEREAIAGRVPDSGCRLHKEDWRVVADNIERAVASAAALDLRCVFHHHAGTYIETPDEIAQLLELTALGLCLDTGHFVYGGGDPVDAVRQYGPRVEYLHFKDVDAARLAGCRTQGLGFLDAVRAGVFCPLGKGCVRFPELLKELDKIGYRGWAVVEQDMDPSAAAAQPPLQSAIASRQFLRDTLGI
ncbi:MAG: TIM barrel protein [Acidobacteriia bacterium]|nr:TIM barrel protein [Terriglobia bacterium]